MIGHDLWTIQIPVLEKVLRTVLVYGGLAVLLRIGGKRGVAQLNSFDLVVMLLLSNVVQNAIIGSDNSLTGGLLGAAVLMAINSVTVRLVNRHAWLVRLFEGDETLLVKDGHPLQRAVRRLGLRTSDVAAALRHQGAADVDEVETATLAPGGSIVVTLKPEAQDVTMAHLQEAHHALLTQIRREIDNALQAMEGRLSAGPANSA